MNLDRPYKNLGPAKRQQLIDNLARAKRYGSPREVWVEDGHVFVEGYDGEIITMTPTVAIEMGKMLSEAGTRSLINRVLQESGDQPF